MIHKYTVPTLLLCFLMACSHSDSHLPAKTMQNLLLDIHLAESYCVTMKDSAGKPLPKNYDTLAVCYKNIFAHYNITRQQFDENMEWYRAHPVELDSMYSDMLSQVVSMQAKADKVPH